MNVLLCWEGPRDAHELEMFSRRQLPLLRQLAADGMPPVVALFGDGGRMRDRLADTPIIVEVLPLLPPPTARLAAVPHAALALRRMIARHRPDVVEAAGPMVGFTAALAGLGRHGYLLAYRRQFYAGYWRHRWTSRIAAKLSDCMIVSCEEMRRRVALDDMPSGRIEVATSGIGDPPRFDAAAIAATRAELGIPADARVVGAIAYLHWHKGIDVLIQALDRLHDVDGLHAFVAGKGREDAALRALAASARVPIRFLGHRDDVHRLIACSDVIAMPSRYEAFGRVTLETMAGGRPLVATDIGGLRDAVVDGETGLRVPVADVGALAGALRTLLDDAALRHRLGAAARRRYQAHYTIAHMAASWRSAWQRAHARYAARGPA